MVTREEIEKVAKLMRIELDDHTVHIDRVQKMIEYFDVLDKAGIESEEFDVQEKSITELREDKYIPFEQGLPARVFWAGFFRRAAFGMLMNKLVEEGKLKAPVIIGRDHLDGGSVASPHRETEGMKDGTDAVSDWPILNVLLNAVSGATWVSFHHGGGVGIGFSQHAGMVIVADGTPEAAARLERVLTNDPGTGVMRHVDAGYQLAVDAAKRHGIKIPMMK